MAFPRVSQVGHFPDIPCFYLNLFSTVLAGARSKFPEFLFTKKSIRKFKIKVELLKNRLMLFFFFANVQ